MGTKQFNDKTTHRQQAKHSIKAGFVRKWENRIPGLFQAFFIFQGLNFFPILYNTTLFFSARSVEIKRRTRSISLIFDTGDKNRDYRTN